MKKIMIATLSIGIVMGLSTIAFANTGTKTEIYKEELAHFKTINPDITILEVDLVMKQRKQLDELYEQLEKLELNYGIRVDNTKDPNKEPKHLDDLTTTQRENCLQLNIKIWDEELQFLDVQYKAGLIKEDMYRTEKKNFTYFKDENVKEKNQLHTN
ncbi:MULTISPECIES: hypothetical protein [Bacillus]|uniref:Uncharacterized protein n=1 Tax=Bacillus pseudomycoides TaxID=64104 RepID=A0A1Y3MEZ4_9BACI|nr:MULTISPECIES: hypothetical protein [Bacillus cereus group]EOQ15199.1 hypothetical protein KOY_00045 [Bacillus cereus VDM021]OOG90242.1 hypothetical protein BTH41_03412 [Bacillus mycoides]MDF2083063.1 hypothetical protein [Bacillus pseudomycoides]OUM48364.1 hypothetical protein BW425_13260 [Bacillus pseudomycoides]PEK70006.1 hypothetical protein CN590_09540 [Bacillus pseudomycoides]